MNSRRRFVKVSTAALGAALLPAGRVWASESPEVSAMKFGMIALTDCSPIVIAHEKGLFKKYGINSTVEQGRELGGHPRLALQRRHPGDAHADRHADRLDDGPARLAEEADGHPLAAQPQRPGDHAEGGAARARSQADPKALKPLVDAAKAAGTPMTFAMTFPPGTHAMWMRYYLAAGGINPDKDVALITIPPPQMVANMKVGKMDGFCVGEPWNARAIADGIGFTAITTQEHLEGPSRRRSAPSPRSSPRRTRRRSRRCSRRCTKPASGSTTWRTAPSSARSSRAPTYINCPPELILGRLQGKYDYRRRPHDAGPELHDLQRAQLQLPAAQVRHLVAHAVPPLGHGRRARPTTPASPSR